MLVPKQQQQFSTVARIHPNIAPHLRSARRMPGWVKPVGAALMVGYGVKTYLDMTYERRLEQMKTAAHEDCLRKQRNEELEDMYGDRSDLQSLERARQFYEKN